MTTKEQEREALRQIREIMNHLDTDGYVATAFAGCLEIAEQNIDNDWACSYKSRAEKAEKDLENYREAAHRFNAQNEEYAREIESLKANMLSSDDIDTIRRSLLQSICESKADMVDFADAIVYYAEDPTSEAFTDAVKGHRLAQEHSDKFNDLLPKLARAKETCIMLLATDKK